VTLPAVVEEWRRRGDVVHLDGHALFAVDRGHRDAPTVVVLHGFPASTFDWRHVVADLAVDHRVVGHDFLGFGLSDKPVDGDYSLFTQADRTERVLGSLGVERAVIVANGSIFVDLVQLSDGQQALLALPDEPLAVSLGDELLRAALAATFPPGRPDADELDAIVALVTTNGGDLLLPRLIRYIEERRSNQPRWTSGLVDPDVPLAAVWGELDPIAVAPMADRLEQLRRHAHHHVEVVRWPDGGHWPAVERPGELAALIRRWTAGWWPTD
jgi:pimeloyl-ACP methyl ester carboxylesterase